METTNKSAKKKTLVATLIVLTTILLVGNALALFIFLSTNVKATILPEPMRVSYAAISNWSNVCSDIPDSSYNILASEGNVSLSNLYPGDQGRICYLVNSTASSSRTIGLVLGTEWGNFTTHTESQNLTVSAYGKIYPNISYTVKEQVSGNLNGDVDFSRY